MDSLSVKKLLEINARKLELIEHSSDGFFSDEYLPVIKSVAGWFNSLPLSLEIYEEPGGAFRCTVESMYFILRQAKDAIFTAELNSEQRRILEPQYKQAAFLAAVSSWLDEPFRHYEIVCNDRIYNPIISGGLTKHLNGLTFFEIQKKESPLTVSNKRTLLMASQVIFSNIDKLDPVVQEALYAAINTDRTPHGNESVLQKVVRKGLAQAEELERGAKRLLVKPEERKVTSAEMMTRSVASDDIDFTKNGDDADQPKPASKPKAVKTDKNVEFEKKQISLPLSQSELPEMPTQWKELFAAMAEDIRLGKKKKEETEWLDSGLLIPKNFFLGYGKSVATCVETLRNLNIIVLTQAKHAVIVKSLGELLVPE